MKKPILIICALLLWATHSHGQPRHTHQPAVFRNDTLFLSDKRDDYTFLNDSWGVTGQLVTNPLVFLFCKQNKVSTIYFHFENATWMKLYGIDLMYPVVSRARNQYFLTINGHVVLCGDTLKTFP